MSSIYKQKTMTNNEEFSIDEETISKIGLRLSDKSSKAKITSEARVFDYPNLENFKTRFTVKIGKHLKVETLKNASPQDIRNMVDNHKEG